MKIKKVEIKWVDATSISGWHYEDSLKRHTKLPTTYSTGYLIKKNKKKTIIVSSLGKWQYGVVTVIPTCLIKSIKRVK